MARGSSDGHTPFEVINQRKQIEEGLENSLGALIAVHEAGRILSSTLSLDEIGTKLLNVAQRVCAFTAAVISLTDERGRFHVLRSRGPESLWRTANLAPEAQAARCEVLKTKKRQAFRLKRSTQDGTFLAGLHLPLVVRDRLTGVLELYGPEALDEKTAVETLESITRLAASALENAKLHQELAERERRLEDLAGRILKIREQERHQLAHDLHDGLVQVAVAVHQNLQAYADDHPLEDPWRRAKLKRALELAKQMVGEARHVIANLRPKALDCLGLAAALRLQIDSLRAEGWEVRYDEDMREERLSPEIETSLYWVAQEALTNVRKHARTTRVHVVLARRGKRVHFEIRDQGRGFDQSAPSETTDPGQRVGLCSMRERIAFLGGEFRIHSQRGAGTSVVAELPLAHGTPTKGKQASVSESRTSPNRLIVADDHALVREGLRTMLASEPDLEVVGEAADGREALEFCRRLCPDLVLMDARMPEMDGLAATRAIRAEGIAARVMMLTSYENPDYLFEAIKAGAIGYVIKDATQHQLIRAVRRALGDENPLNQELAMRLLRRLVSQDELAAPPKLAKHAEALPEPLTPRELEVLQLLAQGQTNRRISRTLVVSPATVKVHVEHIIGKLGVSDRTQAAVRAIEIGLLVPKV